MESQPDPSSNNEPPKPRIEGNLLGFVGGGLSSLALCIPAIVLLLRFGWTVAIMVCGLPIVAMIFAVRNQAKPIQEFVTLWILGLMVGMFFLYNGLSYLQYRNSPW